MTQQKVSAEGLFEVGAHFGHTAKRWNPKMARYNWGKKSNVHIYDLEKTVACLEVACKALSEAARDGKRIAFVGSKRQVREIVKSEAQRVDVAFVTERWLGGSITNWKQIKTRIDRLIDLKKKRDAGDLKKYTKKEQLLFEREILRLESFVGGLSYLNSFPEFLVVVDVHKERAAVREAKLRGVKIVGIVDSNSSPDNIDYVIPMNDDSAKGLEMVMKALFEAIELGKQVKK
jgi:small subunit ribosomal protein S2